MTTLQKPTTPGESSSPSEVSPEAGIDRDSQTGQAKKDRSLTDKPVDHLSDGASDSTHKPSTEKPKEKW